MGVRTYELCRHDLQQLAKQETGTGGGRQAYVWGLRLGVSPDERLLKVPDRLYGQCRGMFRSSRHGGAQERVPLLMRADILEELGHPLEARQCRAAFDLAMGRFRV